MVHMFAYVEIYTTHSCLLSFIPVSATRGAPARAITSESMFVTAAAADKSSTYDESHLVARVSFRVTTADSNWVWISLPFQVITC
jgi:hypothetical protein